MCILFQLGAGSWKDSRLIIQKVCILSLSYVAVCVCSCLVCVGVCVCTVQCTVPGGVFCAYTGRCNVTPRSRRLGA